MAFYKKVQKKVNGKWYPEAVTVGKPAGTDEVADRLAKISTVSRADVRAVLSELGGVMGDLMKEGRSVKLDGVGSFRYTADTKKQGVDTADEVSAKQINGIRVRFVPETTRNADSSVATRSLQPTAVQWLEWAGKDGEDEETDGTGSTDTPAAGEETDGTGSGESNPL